MRRSAIDTPSGAGVGGTSGTVRRWRTDYAAPARKSTPSSATTGPNVLVVDDDPDVRMMLAMYLALDGFHAEEAEDAASALDAIVATGPTWCCST